MYKEVMKLLRANNLQVADSYLQLRLESHPDYPSLIAVQDTLEELGIESYACQGTKEELNAEGKPFLVHLNMNGGHILYFKNAATAEEKVKDFDKYWSGHVMFAEPATIYGNTEHNKQQKKENLNKLFSIAAIFLLIGAVMVLSIANGSLPAILLTVSNLVGLYFSWLITQKEFGISNSVSDKICSMAKHSRCESVLFSKGAKLFNWLTWGDVGIVYFVSSLLFIAITVSGVGRWPMTGSPLQLYYLISIVGLVFPIYSLYYQWKVVKQWCMLCIAVLLVLATNAAIGVSQIFGVVKPISEGRGVWGEVLSLAFIISLTLCAWQLLKSLYQKNISLFDIEIKAVRLKRNPDIFNALLLQQQASPANLPQQDEAIQFGNPAAPYQLVIACNPYCGPCAKAHQAVEHLFEKHPDKLSVAVRFALTNNDDKDGKVIAVKEIIKAAKQKPYEAIKDWYNLFNARQNGLSGLVEKFKALHHTNGINVNADIDKHINWNKNIEIQKTPTFFLNGRKLPELFNWVDFMETIKYKIKN